jgi:hypothetical protein
MALLIARLGEYWKFALRIAGFGEYRKSGGHVEDLAGFLSATPTGAARSQSVHRKNIAR